MAKTLYVHFFPSSSCFGDVEFEKGGENYSRHVIDKFGLLFSSIEGKKDLTQILEIVFFAL